MNLVIARAIANGTNTQRFDGDTENFVVAATLNAGGNNGGFRTEPGEHFVTHTLKAEGHDASEDGTGRGTPMVCFDPTTSLDQAPHETLAPPLKQGTGLPSMPWAPAVAQGMTVRRLTPTECERLQGFPDGWTCTCLPLDEWARDPEGAAERCSCSDSPRYRQMGNAVTVNVVEWIGRRLGTARA